MSRASLLVIGAMFVETWKKDLFEMIKKITELSAKNDRYSFYSLYIRSIDLISITFDVHYGDKRAYRFRYSPFEFRNSVVKEQY
jgi:hypothetical protein